MPTMTYKTQSVTEHVMTDEQASQVLVEIANRVAAGQTDGAISDYVAPGTRTRYWLDQAAAEDWKNWIYNYAAQQGFSIVSFDITPSNIPPSN